LYIFSYTESDRTHKAISLGLCLVCIEFTLNKTCIAN
jgi:hypothetical protein